MREFMMNTMRMLLGGALFAALSAPAQVRSVLGEPALAPKAAASQPRLRIPPGGATQVVLSPITDAEIATVRAANRSMQKRVVIGVVRKLGEGELLPAAHDLAWAAVPGGFAAQVAVRSPAAGAMRVAIDLSGAPEAMQMVFFGSDDPGRLLGPVRVGSIADRGSPWWSPLTDGDTQTVELFAPGALDPRAMSLGIAGASHAFTTIASRFQRKTVEDIGKAESCNVDILCSPLQGSGAFLNVRNSVAEMDFIDAVAGFEGLCTGQILNDTDFATQIPWFYSANHCFENDFLPYKTAAQMQRVASTLNTLWFFEAISCGDTTVPPYSQLFDGATFLYNNPGADSLFLRLHSPPPAGAFFAGWDANAISVGASIVVIHHPQGDLKKVSEGTVVAYSTPQPPLLGGPTTPFSEVKYDSGSTDEGSSGSGLFTFNGTQYLLRGALYGGGAFCTQLTDSDWYSQFDKVYPSLAGFLSPVDYSDLWFNPNESGWGLNIVQHPSRNIFAVWFTYDAGGNPRWYVIPGGTWKVTTNTLTAAMYQTSGPAASAAAFNPALVKVAPVGNVTIAFSDANHGTFSYTVNGVAGSKAITRQPF